MSRSQVPIALSIIWIALNRLLVEGNHVRNQLGLKALVANSPIGVQHLPSEAVAIGEGHPVRARSEVRETENTPCSAECFPVMIELQAAHEISGIKDAICRRTPPSMSACVEGILPFSERALSSSLAAQGGLLRDPSHRSPKAGRPSTGRAIAQRSAGTPPADRR